MSKLFRAYSFVLTRDGVCSPVQSTHVLKVIEVFKCFGRSLQTIRTKRLPILGGTLLTMNNHKAICQNPVRD